MHESVRQREGIKTHSTVSADEDNGQAESAADIC